VGEVRTFFGGNDGSPIMKSPYQFERRGQCGMDVSELFPALGECVDDMCFVRSLTCDSNSHTPAIFQLNTGATQQGFPSLGSWLLYGLGSENPDLPGFCVLVQKNALVNGGPVNWGAGFLGAQFQGTYLRSGTTPILHLDAPGDFPPAAQQGSLDLLRILNDENLRDEKTTLFCKPGPRATILRCGCRRGCQRQWTPRRESAETHKLYALDDSECEDTGRKCLLARRLVERGVRVVQIYSGSAAMRRRVGRAQRLEEGSSQMRQIPRSTGCGCCYKT
jgi:hypothetical protein